MARHSIAHGRAHFRDEAALSKQSCHGKPATLEANEEAPSLHRLAKLSGQNQAGMSFRFSAQGRGILDSCRAAASSNAASESRCDADVPVCRPQVCGRAFIFAARVGCGRLARVCFDMHRA